MDHLSSRSGRPEVAEPERSEFRLRGHRDSGSRASADRTVYSPLDSESFVRCESRGHIITEGSAVPPDPDGGDGSVSDAASLYLRNRGLMLFLAERWLNVPKQDSESLVQDVFLTYLRRASTVREPRQWLIGAIFRASRKYWRERLRTHPLPADIEERIDASSAELVRRIDDILTVHQVFGRTPEQCRVLLRSRYLEGLSLDEIATHRDTTANYAKKLVLGCLKRFRKAFHGGGRDS